MSNQGYLSDMRCALLNFSNGVPFPCCLHAWNSWRTGDYGRRMPTIRPFADPDTDAVVALWERAGLTRPWNDPYRDIARKRTVQPYTALGYTDDEVVSYGKRLIPD